MELSVEQIFVLVYLLPQLLLLPVECRKSRSNSFSILSRLFSYLYSSNVLQVYALVSSEGQVPLASTEWPAD